MKQLTPPQAAILKRVVDEFKEVPGVEAIVLGGSHARGRARPDSDIDIGLYYWPGTAFSIQQVRQIASRINDTPDPVVSGFGEWGRWVDGGAWLTIERQRVDLLYRKRCVGLTAFRLAGSTSCISFPIRRDTDHFGRPFRFAT
jgi:predicted nucleotidyltransferase